jgi:hypothetical protein
MLNKIFMLLVVLLSAMSASTQSIFITSQGGNFPTEKWMSITTGLNGTGTLVWGQGNGTYGNGQGLLTAEEVDLSAYCGQTLYLNAYDRYDDGWDGTTYFIEDALSNILANNGGLSPNSGEDDDCNTSNWCTTDPASELESSEAFLVPVCPCTFPVANFTIVPDCNNGQFSVDVTISSLGDASGADITDGSTTYESNVGLGTYSVGPFAAGSNQTIYVNGGSYGGCDINSNILTEPCVCSNAPIAIVNGSNLNCVSSSYDIEVTVTDFGDGSSSDIYIDGVLTQSNAVLSNTYSFSGYATGQHSVQIQSTGGAFVTCESNYSVNLTCNGSDSFSASAPDITNSCSSGDLSSATVGTANGFTPFCDNGGVASGDISNNVIRACPNGFTNNTDFVDLWYQVYLPDGTDEMTLSITGLGPGEILGFVLHTADPVANASNNVATVDGNFECSFFDQSITSHTLTGLADESTAPLYIRILGIAVNDADCSTIAAPTFTICTTIPEPNDICVDAIDIDDLTASGNLCAASVEAESSESGASCASPSDANDLWFSVTMDGADPDQYLEVDLTFSGASDEVVVELYSNCFSSTFLECATVSSTGVGSTVTHTFNSTITAGGFGPVWYVRVVPAAGNSVCNFDITGRRIALNNACSQFQNVFPGFDITNPQAVDFNFGTDSGSDPTVSGSDLWYQFDPNTGIDNGIPVYSSSADISVNGLNVGEELTILIYQGNTVSSNNCQTLSDDYQASIIIDSDGTTSFNCLDEIHGPANGGYLVRIVQSGGGTTATPTVTITPSLSVGKFNNSCINIWDGNSPANLGVSDALHEFNAYYILDGETITGSFEGTTDCDSEITSSLCSGISNDPFSEADERDLWYIFRVPNSLCPSLTSSTLVNSMEFNYNAGNAFRDAKLYVYSDCGDPDLIACSPTLDGAGDAWTVTGLSQGQYYLLRVKPSSLNSDFDYSFDLSVNNGLVRPCNNEGMNAQALSVNSCNDYDNLPIYSMKGADQSPSTGVPENDVWFSFVAPSPANGGPYFNSNKSWVTIFFENVSGTSTGPLSLQLYSSPSSIVATANTFSTGTSAGSQGFAQFGHLEPGQTYFVRLYHKESETDEVDYKINVYTTNANEVAWSCGNNNASLLSGCSEGCNDLREAYFKIDLPEGTPSNKYFMIEVVGQDQILDFELRSQFLTEASANEGDLDDYDLPCSSRPLEPGVSIVSETLGITSPSTGESCNPNGDPADGGEGVRRVYFGMNGPAAGMKDYYYIRVFLDPSDPNYSSTTGLRICAINFNGPYSSQALAEAGGPIDEVCSVTTLGVDLLQFSGENQGEVNRLKWQTASEENNSHFVIEHSSDGVVFSEIGLVEGMGTTESLTEYQYEHRTQHDENYYRLKQFDFDGEMTMSDVIFLRKDLSGIHVYPNPSTKGQAVHVTADEVIRNIEIKNALGVQVFNESGLNGTSYTTPNIRESGLYFITVHFGERAVTKRFVVR